MLVRTDGAIQKSRFWRNFQVKGPCVDGALERVLKKTAVEVMLSGEDTEDI